jgi:anti-sigma factor RsiW
MADFFSGELPQETRSRFEDHLSLCPNCVAYLSNYRSTIALGRCAFATDDASVPSDVPDGLVKAILASRRTQD